MFGQRSRTAIPVTDQGLQGRTVGLWGMLQLLVVLVVGTAGMAGAALYLHSGQPAWPPEGIAAPGVALGALSVTFSLAACVTVLIARRQLLHEARLNTALALAVTGALVTAAIATLVVDLRAVPFRWDEHAYTSVYWVFTATVMVYHGTALLMLGSLLMQRLSGVVDAERSLELDNTVLMVFFTAAAAIALLGLLHWLPVVTTAEGIGVPQVGPGSRG